MKKILSIALVALLAVSSVFAADFSGSAKIGFGYDFVSKEWGFDNPTKSTKVDISADFASQSVDKVSEGKVYAGIKASFTAKFVAKSGTTSDFVGLKFTGTPSISEAYITDGNWKISILGAMGAPDFAKSYFKEGGKNVTYKSKVAAAPGVTVTVDGYTAAFGIAGDTDDETVDWSAYVATPSYNIAEGLTASFAAAASDKTEIAASAKVAYAGSVSASVASDFGYTVNKDAEDDFDFDVAAQIKVAPVTIDAYYWHSEKAVAAQATASINGITVTVGDKCDLYDYFKYSGNIFNMLEASVKYEFDGITVAANGAYESEIGGTGSYDAMEIGGSVEYKNADFTANANATLALSATDETLKVGASIESKTVLPGATLKLAYAAADVLNEKYGAVDATCTIAF